MTVREEDDIATTSTSHNLDKALEKICQPSNWRWLCFFFFLTSTPGILNSFHISVYVFFNNQPQHWCTIPQLETAGWSILEIRNFTVPKGLKDPGRSCSYYDWNYTQIATMSYSAATALSAPLPPVKQCMKRSFLEKNKGETIESEWDLVCERAVLKPSVQGIFAIGKFIGALLFGVLADKYGRRSSFFWASCLYILSIPASSLTYSFPLFLMTRFAIGVAGSGAYESAFTILTETTTGNARTFLGTLSCISYPIGMIILPVIASICETWRTLQLYLTAFIILLIIDCWYVPESARWLLAEGREDEAWAVVKKIDKTIESPTKQLEAKKNKEETVELLPWHGHILELVKKFTSLFSDSEIRARTLICYFAWFVSALAYYLVALSGENFAVNKYYYIALNGLCEIPSYFIPIPLLHYFGRKATAILLYMCSGACQLSILFFDRSQINWVTAVSLFGRTTGSAVFCSLVLQTTELFPTAHRNTAVGSSLMLSQVGSFVAPYLVASVGTEKWYIPSVICGILSICTGFLFCIIPETTNRPLYNTSKDIPLDERVSIAQCCKFK